MALPVRTAERDRIADGAFIAALASGSAGIIHLSVVAEHMVAWWAYGAFFLVVGIAQVASGLVLLRGAREGFVSAAVLGNAAVILLYVVSRTVGVPVGPEHEAHQLEGSGPLDLAATAAEVVLVVSLLPRMASRARRIAIDLLLVCGLALWLLRALGRLG